MTELVIRLPPKLKPVFRGRADVRGAYGGRGSAKTRSFAKMAAVMGMRFGQAGIKGQILCARQFMNSLEDSSLEEVKRAIESEPVLAAYWVVGEKFIKSSDGNVWFSFAGLDRNIGSIKSKGRILICWVDEAEPVTDDAWDTLEPTLREEDEDFNAELWVTWNPKRKTAAVDRKWRNSKDPLVKVVELNWRDNPKFPAILERKRLRCLEDEPEQYKHIWEGGFITALSGAYFAQGLAKAQEEGRIGFLAADPLMTTRAYWDIGGTGAKADACAIWIVQFIGREIRVLRYYEAVGQPLATHIEWLRRSGYERAQCVLPHDGANHDKVYSVSYESALRAAGFDVRVIPNMGAGAAMTRIETVRRVMPSVRFDAEGTEAGRDALGWYHEKRDEKRGIGLGPNHDWASHGADAFGLMAVDFQSTNHDAPNLDALLNYTTDY
ncbi:MAG: phage terminase large subunit [Stenotrophomonas sp.]